MRDDMKSMRVAYLAVLAAVACGGEAPDDGPDLKQLWLETAPQQYVARLCSTGFTARSCTVSAVSDGQAVAAQSRLGDGEWEDEDPPVDVVASMLNAATLEADDGCERRVTLHETHAFPSLVYTDCGQEGWGTEISCFEADTVDLGRCR